MPYDKNGLWIEPKPERVIIARDPKPKVAKKTTAKKTTAKKTAAKK